MRAVPTFPLESGHHTGGEGRCGLCQPSPWSRGTTQVVRAVPPRLHTLEVLLIDEATFSTNPHLFLLLLHPQKDRMLDNFSFSRLRSIQRPSRRPRARANSGGPRAKHPERRRRQQTWQNGTPRLLLGITRLHSYWAGGQAGRRRHGSFKFKAIAYDKRPPTNGNDWPQAARGAQVALYFFRFPTFSLFPTD